MLTSVFTVAHGFDGVDDGVRLVAHCVIGYHLERVGQPRLQVVNQVGSHVFFQLHLREHLWI